MRRIGEHLRICKPCSDLFSEMQAAVSLCHGYPTLEMDPDFLEKILLRTSGRPRTRSFRERFNRYFLGPLLTPRFAAGAVLATLFVALMANLMGPKMSTAFSDLSPSGIFQKLDLGVQQVYGEGLKAYDKLTSWHDRFRDFKNSAPDKLRHMIEQMEPPVEGRKKPEEQMQEKKKPPKDKSSSLVSWPA